MLLSLAAMTVPASVLPQSWPQTPMMRVYPCAGWSGLIHSHPWLHCYTMPDVSRRRKRNARSASMRLLLQSCSIPEPFRGDCIVSSASLHTTSQLNISAELLTPQLSHPACHPISLRQCQHGGDPEHQHPPSQASCRFLHWPSPVSARCLRKGMMQRN
jgi:hypothetical protein